MCITCTKINVISFFLLDKIMFFLPFFFCLKERGPFANTVYFPAICIDMYNQMNVIFIIIIILILALKFSRGWFSDSNLTINGDVSIQPALTRYNLSCQSPHSDISYFNSTQYDKILIWINLYAFCFVLNI